MDMRNLPNHLPPIERCEARRRQIEQELGIDLSTLSIDPTKIGHAEERNCEQMFGHVPIPVGYAGPLTVTFSSGETADIHLPLATTEGALVASVNRGCKALRMSGGVKTKSTYHGVSRSIALRMSCHGSTTLTMTQSEIQKRETEWKSIGETTSNHLKILKYEIDTEDPYLFLTIYADTDEAMGMNMVTIAAEKIGQWIEKNLHLTFITVAGNVDSDKKPSKRTHDKGRGYEVTATATISADVISSVLKTTPEAMFQIAHAKLDAGSDIAGALGHNCHAANIIAALYIATGQDPAHVVEGSLADTTCRCVTLRDPPVMVRDDFASAKSLTMTRADRLEGRPAASHAVEISVRLPAILVGIRGGGTTLPAQSQCLKLLLGPTGPRTQDLGHCLHPCRRLAESIGAAVLAGELSLLAALSSHNLAQSHKILAISQ
ncbi:hypothetical protein A3E47_02450 [Candidatus Peribacteria bacterium RIFCSPHIGHO2_12_FULL_54_10]|nr:MAG: hypothetical protein A3E47_02450 [Candidatus Peribacteria bacterium RIFCSPHIGHO2_12_FULL_54_10]